MLRPASGARPDGRHQRTDVAGWSAALEHVIHHKDDVRGRAGTVAVYIPGGLAGQGRPATLEDVVHHANDVGCRDRSRGVHVTGKHHQALAGVPDLIEVGVFLKRIVV